MDVNNSISLLSHIHTITADFLIDQLKSHGFQMKSYASSYGNILFQLKKNGPMKMMDLARSINRDKSTTSVLVKNLESEGLVEKRPFSDTEDKRCKLVALTKEGARYNNITSEISKDLIQTFYKDFTDPEKEQFLSYLERIEKNFKK